MSESKTKKTVEYIPTGNDLLDLVLSGGQGEGMEQGKILNLVGDKSTGKTFFASELIGAAKHKFGKHLKFAYDDAENGFTFDTKELYGVDIEKHVIHSKTVEEFSILYNKFLDTLKGDDIGIYVLDSLDGLSSDENEDRQKERRKAYDKGKEFDKGSYQMGMPKFLSQEFFKTAVDKTAKKNCLLIILSQVRENVDPYSFKKWNRSGGKALDFYCHTILALRTKQKEVRAGKVVGVVVNAKTEKNKTARPFRECDIPLYFDYGMDNVGSNLDFLFDLRTPTGQLTKTAKVLWDGQKETATTVKAFLDDNGLWEKYKEKTGSKDYGKSKALEFIEGDTDIKKLYSEKSGRTFTRKEAIDFIEKNNLEQELTQKVRDKWEMQEQKAKTKRVKKKYNT